jgi:ABC-type transporter Mla subunit MlaD
MSATTTATVWSDVVAFFQNAEADVAKFLGDVASGAEILIEDIEDVAAYVEAHLGIITSTITTLGTLANTVAPNNATVTKVLTDLQTAATDTATLSASLSSGSTAGDPAVVTTAVTAINSVNTLAGIAAQASTALGQIVAATPTATQAISQPTPNEG